MMRWKCGFRSISFGNCYLPIAAVCRQCQENRHALQRVEALVHTPNEIGIEDDACIEFSTVNSQSECAVILRFENKRKWPFGLSWFGDSHRSILAIFFFSILQALGPAWYCADSTGRVPLAINQSLLWAASFSTGGHPTWVPISITYL